MKNCVWQTCTFGLTLFPQTAILSCWWKHLMGFSVISIHLLIIHRLEELGGLPGPVTALLETFISLSKIIFFFQFEKILLCVSFPFFFSLSGYKHCSLGHSATLGTWQGYIRQWEVGRWGWQDKNHVVSFNGWPEGNALLSADHHHNPFTHFPSFPLIQHNRRLA